MKTKVIIALSISLILSACTYYEHGPVISFKSAKTRISGEWQLTDVIVNDKTDEIILDNENTISYTFIEDGSLIINNSDHTRSTTSVVNGTWEFNKDKTTIKLDIVNPGSDLSILDSEMTILRLTSDELWISDENSSNRVSDYITERRYQKITKEWNWNQSLSYS